MKSIFVITYRVYGYRNPSRFVTFAPDFPEAFERFRQFTGARGLENDRFAVVNHWDMQESEIEWPIHRNLITSMPDEELREVLELRKARQFEQLGNVDKTTSHLLRKLNRVKTNERSNRVARSHFA